MAETFSVAPEREAMRAFVEALSLLGDDAALLVDEHAKIYDRNSKGRAMLAEGDGRMVESRNGRLRFGDSGEQARFRMALARSFQADREFRATLGPELIAIFRRPTLSASA